MGAWLVYCLDSWAVENFIFPACNAGNVMYSNQANSARLELPEKGASNGVLLPQKVFLHWKGAKKGFFNVLKPIFKCSLIQIQESSWSLQLSTLNKIVCCCLPLQLEWSPQRLLLNAYSKDLGVVF